MYLCYVDEAGCPGALPSATSDVQPVLVLSALIFEQRHLISLTRDFIALKQQFNPGVAANFRHEMQMATYEIKGSELKKTIRNGNRNERRRVFGFIDKTLNILDAADAKLVCRIYIKRPAHPFDGKAVYTSAVQVLGETFQQFLTEKNSEGLIIADNRTPAQNLNVSHSIFAQKFRRTGGDPFGRVLEMPVFGQSENHAAIQITDFICSTLLAPMAAFTYCTGHITSVHVNANDFRIRERCGQRLKGMRYKYSVDGKIKGGIAVNDAILKRSNAEMLA